MAKKILLVFILMIGLFFCINHKEFKTNNTKFNIYLKNGNTYEKSNLNEFPKTGIVKIY